MKTIRHICLLAILLTSIAAMAQEDVKISAEDVNGKQFIFHARAATPLGGRYLVLNYPYDCRVTPDSLISNLPYFGRAYSAPMTSQEAGLTFNAADFSYTVDKADGKKFEITIETKDQRENSKYFFALFANGEAQLMVQPFNRQSIRFDGTVERTGKN